ncbi:MAG: hypothetical protein VX463_06635 [Pseudomonadota bacterium]|nr:hypothetical protein [Pseudomonadota bacterium]
MTDRMDARLAFLRTRAWIAAAFPRHRSAVSDRICGRVLRRHGARDAGRGRLPDPGV